MNIAVINQNGGRYLFEVPQDISLKEGESVKCDTKRGITDGIVWADSLVADEPTAKLIGKLVGAKFPLKSVVGKMEYAEFVKPATPTPAQDKPVPKFKVGDKAKVIKNTSLHNLNIGDVVELYQFDNDCAWRGRRSDGTPTYGNWLKADDIEPYAEPKPEPVKLYCVKDRPSWAKKGDIFTINTNGRLVFPDGEYGGEYSSLEDFYTRNTDTRDRFFPLVKREAKVGEWVLVTNATAADDCYENGNVLKVLERSTGVYVETQETHACCKFSGHIGCSFLRDSEYLVLDGYHPEPEKTEPKYYSGKVVCVDNKNLNQYTVGKVYSFINGKSISDFGNEFPSHARLNSFSELSGKTLAKFIEYKGGIL